MAYAQYPSVLPLALQNGRSYKTTSTVKRSTMATGRALQRKRYPDVPTYAKFEWLMNSAESQAFQGWCRDAIHDCVDWFDCPAKTPLGLNIHTIRMTDSYDGPTLRGPDLWMFSAEIEFMKRPLIKIGDGLFPEDIVYSKLFDITMNRNWPEND